jgi:hypothetical protein
VTWTAPLQNVGSDITSYILWWKTQAEGDYLNSNEVSSDTFSHTITGLSEGVYYDVKVQAKNVVGSGAKSFATRIVAAVAPQPPSLLQIVAQSSDQITIEWMPVTGSATGGTPITSYEIFWKRESDETFTFAGQTTVSTNQLSKAISSPGTVFEFYVVAKNDAGTSTNSAVLQVKAADSPSTMQAPTKVIADETTIVIGWSAPSDTGYSDVTGYLIYWNGGGLQSILPEPVHDTGNAETYTFTISAPDISIGVTYSFTVAAYNDVSVSE